MNNNKKKVLLIEDDHSLAILIKNKLEKESLSVVVTEDGKDAVEFIKEENPDLLLLDIELPHKNGIEILEELKKDESLGNIPIIVISNSGNPVDVYHLKQLGVKDYLVKVDFDLDELMNIVRNYI